MTTAQPSMPMVLPVRERARVIRSVLEQRLASILPAAMRQARLDMWLIVCQEDDLDPVFTTMMPMDTWCPILQMLILYDPGGEGEIERINLSMTRTGGLYDRPWNGQRFEEQWALLREIVQERNPRSIGINIGKVQWAAGGLTSNLQSQIVAALGDEYAARLVSAEPAATHWLATLTADQIGLFEHVVGVSRTLISECYSRQAILPGVTTTEDLEWHYWQRCSDLGIGVSFKPFFNIVRRDGLPADGDKTILPGDFLHCDVGVRYLGLNSDHQQMAYVLRRGETGAPEGARHLLAEANRLQELFMSEFALGRSGNELLAAILGRAREVGIPNPRVYSHSLGQYLHEPGPLIGLPWEQERCPGRGDVRLGYGNCFTMELSVAGPLAEWGGQQIRVAVEEDVAFTETGCATLGGRQTEFYLV